MDQAKCAFMALKQAPTSAPILQNPNFDFPFLVQMNALETGLGAVLRQQKEKEERLKDVMLHE